MYHYVWFPHSKKKMALWFGVTNVICVEYEIANLSQAILTRHDEANVMHLISFTYSLHPRL